MKLPINTEIWAPLIFALAAAPVWAALPWRRRAHAKVMGGKWRRSNAVVTVGTEAREMLATASRWLNDGADDPDARDQIAAQAQAIREKIATRLLNLRGIYGLSRRQRALLEEMVCRLDALGKAVQSGLPPTDISHALSLTEQILDDQSLWRILMLRYRFWPFPIGSRGQSRAPHAAPPPRNEQAASRT